MSGGSVLSGFAGKLAGNRRLEMLVYCALILTAAVIFAAAGGISCGGSANGASEKEALPEGDELESRLGAVLSSIEGAGRVRVLLTRERSAGASGAFASAAYEENGPVNGVIVVADGARELIVASRLREAVVTALGIDASRVSVFTMRAEENNGGAFNAD